jgi:LysM domain
MTERGLPIVDGAPACPFVAFEDDRDERAASPDHRHRCYAEARPAPRALAHQEAYCLSSAFPVCPTFQDWARREAAHSRADGPRQAESGAATVADQPQRNPPRNWAAPPPWAAGEGGHEDEDWQEEGAPAGEAVPRRGRGLSGSYADRVASGTAGAGVDEGEDERGSDEEAGAAAAAALAERQRERDPGRVAAFETSGESHGAPPPPRHERRRDSDAPEWERARPVEVYPTLRARRLPELSVPPLLVAVVALALAAAVLFALPGLLGFGSPSSVGSASPSSPVSSAAAETFAPTPVPQPTQQVYIVQSGDTMSKIAKKFHLALADLIAANAETIPNPDRLQIGDQVIIPVPQPSSLPAASEAPASS